MEDDLRSVKFAALAGLEQQTSRSLNRILSYGTVFLGYGLTLLAFNPFWQFLLSSKSGLLKNLSELTDCDWQTYNYWKFKTIF